MPFWGNCGPSVVEVRAQRRRERSWPARVYRGVYTDHKRRQIDEHCRKRELRAVFPDC